MPKVEPSFEILAQSKTSAVIAIGAANADGRLRSGMVNSTALGTFWAPKTGKSAPNTGEIDAFEMVKSAA